MKKSQKDKQKFKLFQIKAVIVNYAKYIDRQEPIIVSITALFIFIFN